jgi:phosphatidylserine decarboxylase
MNREGVPTVAGLTIFALLVGWFGLRYGFVFLLIIAGMSLALALFSLYFFRDPKRTPPDAKNVVLSPADGKIIAIDEIQESEFIEGPAKRVAIFLSLFNVHVNYVPFTGVVDLVRFQRGSNVRADLPEASTHNVNILTGLETEHGKLAFKQSTGMVARRLVNYLRLGDSVQAGQKFGIIKFGSRMEVYLPMHAEVTVKLGDRVKAGETIVATFNE